MASGDEMLKANPLPPRRHGRAWFLLAYISFATWFHSVWEIAHIRLYTIWRSARGIESAYAIVHCTVGDALIATATMGLALVVFRADLSGASAFGKLAAAATVLGVAYTIFSEWLNVEVRQTWSYTESMPRIPLLGIGLTPFLQWLVITPGAMFAVRGVAPLSQPGAARPNSNRPVLSLFGLLALAVLAIGLAGVPPALAVETTLDEKSEEGKPFPELWLPPSPERLAILSEMRPTGRGNYLSLLTREAEQRGLPPAIADAVARVESGYDPSAIGKVGEFGLMQVRAMTAEMLGHRGPLADLFVPETNIRYGVEYLARAWQLARGDLCRTLMKYRAGHGEERMTPLSVEYCRRARQHLAAIGSPLAEAPLLLPRGPAAATSVGTSSTAQLKPALQPAGLSSAGRIDPAKARMAEEAKRLWAEHVARVKTIEAKIDRIMSAR